MKKIRNRKIFVFIVNSLGVGGAQKVAALVANQINSAGYNCVIYWIKKVDNDINGINLNEDITRLSGFYGFLNLIWNLLILKINNNDVKLVSYLYISDTLAFLIGKIFFMDIFWNIRNEISPFLEMGVLSKICLKLNRYSSTYINKIIYCSNRSKKQHNFSPENYVVLPNPLPSMSSVFSADIRNALRSEFCLTNSDVVIGFIGRNSSVKNFSLFVDSFINLINAGHSNVYSIVYGDLFENDPNFTRLKNTGLLLGCFYEVDLRRIYSFIDVLCITSYSEGSSNVALEATSANIRIVIHEDIAENIPNTNAFLFSNYTADEVSYWLGKAIKGFIAPPNNTTDKLSFDLHPITKFLLSNT